METISYSSKPGAFDVPDIDFENFQELFADFEPMSPEEAIDAVKTSGYVSDTGSVFSREYTDEEIISIFEEDCRLSGRDKEISKDKIANSSDRRKAQWELEEFIKKDSPISKESAKTILNVMKAFDSYECEID